MWVEKMSAFDHIYRLSEDTESRLACVAKRSFEAFSPTFSDGSEINQILHEESQKKSSELYNRTPIQRERDRILYSHLMRKQVEKNHILYNGSNKIVRSYSTHTMRMAQVTRAICKSLRLNTDFGEAIALGSKLGATPFVHAAKESINSYVVRELIKIANSSCESRSFNKNKVDQQKSMRLEGIDIDFPIWVHRIECQDTMDDIQKFMPFARGRDVDRAYCSGGESALLLTVDPFTRRKRKNSFYPETLYGIWRHSRGLAIGPGSFSFKRSVQDTGSDQLRQHFISSEHITYESIVASYADDITWTIENLNDANTVALLSGKESRFNDFHREMMSDREIPNLLRVANNNDPGELYNYFITDFIRTSGPHIGEMEKQHDSERKSLRKSVVDLGFGLSEEAQIVLDRIIEYLGQRVFSDSRVKNRTQLLAQLSAACVDIIYAGGGEYLEADIKKKKRLFRWSDHQQAEALRLIEQSAVHRLQLSVDVFAEMGDLDVFEFAGVESL